MMFNQNIFVGNLFVQVISIYLEMMGGRPLPAGELGSQLQAVAEQVVEVL